MLLSRLFGRRSSDDTKEERVHAIVERKEREIERELKRIEVIIAAERMALEAEKRRG